MAASHALVKRRHGLVGTANLHLEEGRLVAVAALGRALHAALLRIVPGAGAAKDVLLFLALVDAPREDGLGDCVLKGTGAAFEAVGALRRQGDGEDVCAVRADCWTLAGFSLLAGEGGTERTEEHGGRIALRRLAAGERIEVE